MTIRVKTSDLAANPLITLERFSQAALAEYVFIRNISEFTIHKISATRTTHLTSFTVYTSNTITKVALWNARDIVTMLTDQGIAFEETILIRELKGTTTPTPTALGSVLIARLPQQLVSAVPWIIEDERRYLVITNGARTGFSKEERPSIIRASRGHVVLMMDSQEQAITIKLKRGGSVFDMRELRA